MLTAKSFFFIIACTLVWYCADGAALLMEYALCQSEYLRVKCEADEVVVVEHARYGRMSISRCVKQDFGFVGCSVDVLPVLDNHCSGRRACSVRVLDDNFDNVKPCHDDLKSYLEVSYRCIKGLISSLSVFVMTSRGELFSLY